MIYNCYHTEKEKEYDIEEYKDYNVYYIGDIDNDEDTMKNIQNEALDIIGRYKHFKGNEYEVLGIVINKGQKMVLYKPLYESKTQYFIRPFDMFFSKVDKFKYPNVKAIYRFTKIKE